MFNLFDTCSNTEVKKWYQHIRQGIRPGFISIAVPDDQVVLATFNIETKLEMTIGSSPMCRQILPTSLPFPSWVTRRLQSQCPPLNSRRPSLETTSTWALISTPGEKGPIKKRCVLHNRTGLERSKQVRNKYVKFSCGLNVEDIYNQHIKLSWHLQITTCVNKWFLFWFILCLCDAHSRPV